MEVSPEATQLAELAKDWPEINHLYMIENFLRRLVPQEMASVCDLSLTLTDTGIIMLVLEAVNPQHSPTCQAAAMEVAERINTPSGDKTITSIARKARLLGGFVGDAVKSSIKDQADLIRSDIDQMKYDTSSKMTNTYNDRMMSLEEYTNNSENIITAPIITVITLVAMTTTIVLCV